MTEPVKTRELLFVAGIGGLFALLLSFAAASWAPNFKSVWVADRSVKFEPTPASRDPMLQGLAECQGKLSGMNVQLACMQDMAQ